jgi:pyruvate/2-oxoglutarate dehydrogenase complex dihydrolipoamide dehydrogenase (E3) component
VTVVEVMPQFLIREDKDAADILARAFEKEGISVLLDAKVERVTKKGKRKAVHIIHRKKKKEIIANEILVGAGRAPNVEGLNLEAVGVEHDRFGVKVNDNLRTTNRRIYAAGDVANRYKFTHTADFSARIVIQNALFLGRKEASALTVPWVTYTDPEIAHVGMYERDAAERGIEVDTFKVDFKDVDRAVIDGEEEGFVKIHVKRGTDKILGATIVGRDAGDMISEITLAMVTGTGLGAIASVIHPYPTRAEAIRRLGDEYNRTRLTPTLKKLFRGWLSLGR